MCQYKSHSVYTRYSNKRSITHTHIYGGRGSLGPLVYHDECVFHAQYGQTYGYDVKYVRNECFLSGKSSIYLSDRVLCVSRPPCTHTAPCDCTPGRDVREPCLTRVRGVRVRGGTWGACRGCQSTW